MLDSRPRSVSWALLLLASACSHGASGDRGDAMADDGDGGGLGDRDATPGGDGGSPSVCDPSAPTLVPGVCHLGFDHALEDHARDYDRAHHAFGAAANGAASETIIDTTHAAQRAAVQSFLRTTDDWDFTASTGLAIGSTVDQFQKVAGYIAGSGMVADAYRYGVLRDQAYPASEIDRARADVLHALEHLHMASALTGVPGVVVRGWMKKDIPGYLFPTMPLFDSGGAPLPPEKTNGTWRDDNSGGRYPDVIWEDSCSRDQFLGWAMAYGALWEVIADDPTIPAALKSRLRADAAAIGHQLMTVRASGYDLEILDADGRTAFHGYMNENNFERQYLPSPSVRNGAHAMMALGSVAALAYASGDATIAAYLDDELIGARGLHLIVRDELVLDAGPKTNFSNYNMAFMGAWMAVRYVAHPAGRAAVRASVEQELYERDLSGGLPGAHAWGQSFFDFVYASSVADVMAGQAPTSAADGAAIARGVATLASFPEPPYWEHGITNCDAGEQLFTCQAVDGTPLTLVPSFLSDELMATTPLPLAIRPRSNYHWRSNPFAVNAPSGEGRMTSGADFRLAYWIGRWVRE